jgi:hypothetical protein
VYNIPIAVIWRNGSKCIVFPEEVKYIAIDPENIVAYSIKYADFYQQYINLRETKCVHLNGGNLIQKFRHKYKGRSYSYIVRVGSRGGKYIVVNKKKIYI